MNGDDSPSSNSSRSNYSTDSFFKMDNGEDAKRMTPVSERIQLRSRSHHLFSFQASDLQPFSQEEANEEPITLQIVEEEKKDGIGSLSESLDEKMQQVSTLFDGPIISEDRANKIRLKSKMQATS